MTLPKFLLGDNTDCPDDIFVIHTDYPRFIINLVNDEVEWFDDLEGEETELANEVADLIEQAGTFLRQGNGKVCRVILYYDDCCGYIKSKGLVNFWQLKRRTFVPGS
ncbi:MAG: hypothetical protein U5K51_07880 [Flavobacteriaceae bacterium]|nr:hypothetical protein [Flavobacteriaceae bacterium]